MQSIYRWLLASVLMLSSLAAVAHKSSDSYLGLRLDESGLTGQWDIALRDLEYAIGIDADDDGAISWKELKARHQVIADYALGRLGVLTGDRPCTVHPREQLVDDHSDGTYTVLRFNLNCPVKTAPLRLEYRLFFDLDPSHRGLLRIQYPDSVRSAVLSPEQPVITLDAAGHSRWRQFGEYWREGVWHIWIGFDHILFLLALLLPAVLWREGGRWRQVEALRPALMNVAGIVTAFTVAHSLTLSMAVLGWVSLPSRWVESAIAATVILAALNNLYPLVQGRRWLIAFCLGLIHGFGFASVLTDLGLPGGALALALVGFNLGVETGQLAIVAAFLPVAFLLRGSWFYRRAALEMGSLVVLAIAMVWLLERALNRSLVPL